MDKPLIAIEHEMGDVRVHIAGSGASDYATVCGEALDGDYVCGTRVPTPPRARVTCGACTNIWRLCRGVRSDWINA